MALTRCFVRCISRTSRVNALLPKKGDLKFAKDSLGGVQYNLASLNPAKGSRSLSGIKSYSTKASWEKFNSELDSMLPPDDASAFKDLVPLHVPFNDPEKGELVYYGLMTKQVRGVKIFSLSTTVIAGGLQPYFFLNADKIVPALKFVMGGLMTVIMFGTPILIHLITKSHVVSMYYNSDTEIFTATTYNILLREKIWKFKAEDITFPDVPGPFTYMKLNGKSLNLDPMSFFSRPVFIKLHGFDKPLDWTPEMQQSESNQDSEKTSRKDTESNKDASS